MRRNEFAVKPTQNVVISPSIISGTSPTVGTISWVLGLGLLAVSLYLAPTITALALAVFGLGLPLLLLAWFWPEFGLLALIFLTASFVPADTVDLRLPVGGLDLRDLTLIAMLGILILQGVIRKKLTIPWWPVSGPLLVFLGFAVFSALYALLYQGVEVNWALGELRTLIHYAVFFVTGWAITRRHQLTIVLAGLFVLADLTAGIILLQQSLGTENRLLAAMWGSRGWHVWKQFDASVGVGVARIIPPGHVLVYFMMVMAFCLMLSARQNSRLRAIFALHFVFLNVGLFFTYTRAQWVASAIALGLIFIFLSSADKIQLFRYVLIVILVLLPVYVLFGAELGETLNNTPVVDALVSRVLSIFTPQQTLETDSLEWRIFETDEALRSISQNPLIGVGLGNVYRDATLLQGEASSGNLRLTRYVHNSYLYMAVKMGLLGLMTFLWFCLAFLASGWRVFRSTPCEQFKPIMLAILASFVGLLAWSITQSHLLQVESTSVVGLMVGMIAAMQHLDRI